MQLTPRIGGADQAGLAARVHARLDQRLSHQVDHPLALALSGGGDSIALLRLAADWAKTRGRRLLALTVDHGLQADSAAWTAFAAEAARAQGAQWVGLGWAGDKPATGVTAAARLARHRLIADAARQAGARVVLFAHNADDIAEADWMRAQGSTLGRLRDWSPSPVWPEGRGLMLVRPLLSERRETLRNWLSGQGADWIDDPANEDPRYGRSRARQALQAMAGAPVAGFGAVHAPRTPPIIVEEGIIHLDRSARAAMLAAALVCAGGGSTPPRGGRLSAILERLRASEDFVAVLVGARLEATADRVIVMREAGEWSRRPIAPLRLEPGQAAVWDGRCLFTAREAGWTVVAARRRLSSLTVRDRAALSTLPPAARAAVPVLLRDGETAPVLAGSSVQQRDLVPERLRLALDETTHEDDLNHPPDGVTPWNLLFSRKDIPDREPALGLRTTEDLNEPA
nr:tRNA lysidine(34) synthetase TilS [uncultured Brevundimonas sp.]